MFKGQVASSHILLAQGNCLLVLADDLVTRWHALTLAHQVRLKCYLSNQDIYLSQTASPVRMPASVFICKKKLIVSEAVLSILLHTG